MPVSILSDAEREAWSRFPEVIDESALGAFFTLSADESASVRRLRGDESRLAVAVQACSLRWLGFIPDELAAAPERGVRYLAEQLDVSVSGLAVYGQSLRTGIWSAASGHRGRHHLSVTRPPRSSTEQFGEEFGEEKIARVNALGEGLSPWGVSA